MPVYLYQAFDSNGNKQKAKIEAESKDVVRSMLKSRNLSIISIQEENVFNKDISLSTNKVFSAGDVALFSRQFSILLKSGISISMSLDILKDQIENKKMAEVVAKVHQEVQDGEVLSKALKNTKKFPELFVNTVASGESGGNMDEIMERMATYYEKTTKTSSKVKSALIYPCIVLLVTIVVTYILVTKVVPTFVSMFDTIGSELPALTRALIALSDFFNTYWLILFIVLGAIIATLMWYMSTDSGKFQRDVILSELPVVRDLVRKSAIAKFCRTMSIMLRSGIPMINAIDFSSRVVNNLVITKALIIVKNKVETGSSLSAPIEEMKLFPKLVISMIRIGEETGALDDMLNKCADFYEDEVETAAARVTSLIEPMVIIILALVVGTVVMAIITPMFQMYNDMM